MTILEAHTLFKLVADKSGSDYWPHPNIDNVLHMAQIEYFAQLIGNYRQHQAGRPVPLVAVGQNTRLSEELAPFKKDVQFYQGTYDATSNPYAVDDGFFVLPSDYQHLDAIVTTALHPVAGQLEGPADELDGEEWANRASSSLVAPTKTHAIYRWAGTAANSNLKLEFRPKDVAGRFIYYRMPLKPNYVFTINTLTREETHNAGASIDLEWNEVASQNILIRALELAGVPQADDRLKQAMMQNKMESE